MLRPKVCVAWIHNQTENVTCRLSLGKDAMLRLNICQAGSCSLTSNPVNDDVHNHVAG